jgi:hypothetical protein
MADSDFNVENLRIKGLPQLDPAAVKPADHRPRATKDDKHIGCPLWWLQCVLPVVKSKQQLAVAIYFWRRWIVCGKRKIFDVPNGELKALKISRQTKYRTAELLAAAGLMGIHRGSIKDALALTILAEAPRSKRQ